MKKLLLILFVSLFSLSNFTQAQTEEDNRIPPGFWIYTTVSWTDEAPVNAGTFYITLEGQTLQTFGPFHPEDFTIINPGPNERTYAKFIETNFTGVITINGQFKASSTPVSGSSESRSFDYNNPAEIHILFEN